MKTKKEGSSWIKILNILHYLFFLIYIFSLTLPWNRPCFFLCVLNTQIFTQKNIGKFNLSLFPFITNVKKNILLITRNFKIWRKSQTLFTKYFEKTSFARKFVSEIHHISINLYAYCIIYLICLRNLSIDLPTYLICLPYLICLRSFLLILICVASMSCYAKPAERTERR